MSLPKRASKWVLKSHMHHKPVLKIIPLKRQPKRTEAVFKPYRQHIIYYEEITAPTSKEWKEI